MNLLSATAAPGVAEHAEALADAACELHDAARSPDSWSEAAAEDAVEAMETTALALRGVHPAAAVATDAVFQALARLRRDLGLPAGDTRDDQDQAVTPPSPIRRRTARRGLGPGYQGVRIPQGRPRPAVGE
ncbi:hypothetical protein [Streptomyces rubradiris]|uniref:hypothetical protein n=1 Tax=Streptomyces rubradiris TaxID=285531 RepID=UPI0016747276|nr:hypothetical protein [Streptomyces rubradiris]